MRRYLIGAAAIAAATLTGCTDDAAEPTSPVTDTSTSTSATAAGSPAPGSLREGATMNLVAAKLTLPVLVATPPGPVADPVDPTLFPMSKYAVQDGWSESQLPSPDCTVHDAVLLRDTRDHSLDPGCRVTKGFWTDPLNGATATDPNKVEVVYLVPLENAWASGAHTWNAKQRNIFANSSLTLVTLSPATVEARNNRAPDQWRPGYNGCTYAIRWIDVKNTYGLTVTEPERSALAGMLDTCSTTGT